MKFEDGVFVLGSISGVWKFKLRVTACAYHGMYVFLGLAYYIYLCLSLGRRVIRMLKFVMFKLQCL